MQRTSPALPVQTAMSRWRSPAWLLFFLSPAIGELLTIAAPPAKFFNPWINPNYHHGQGMLSFFYPPDPRGPARRPDPKITPSYRLTLLRDGLQDNALWRIVQVGADDAGQPVRVSETVRRGLESQLGATWVNPTQWRVSRPHHQAWRRALHQSIHP